MKDDITFCMQLHKILATGGLDTSSTSSDLHGYSHCIKFSNENCKGKIHTVEGNIVLVEVD